MQLVLESFRRRGLIYTEPRGGTFVTERYVPDSPPYALLYAEEEWAPIEDKEVTPDEAEMLAMTSPSERTFEMLGRFLVTVRDIFSDARSVDAYKLGPYRVTVEWLGGPPLADVVAEALPQQHAATGSFQRGMAGLRRHSKGDDSETLTWLPVPNSRLVLRRLEA
jgi:hypothetical protein